MLTEHRLTVYCVCPKDGRTDEYTLTVSTSRLICVEDILIAVVNHTRKPQYQEHLTLEIAHELNAAVTTVGFHSGVQTTCRAGILLDFASSLQSPPPMSAISSTSVS